VHSSAQHWIGMVGFTPGSPQLMFFRAERTLSAPKYQRVRTYTPEGTIGLGGSLTAIYPVPSPGGYQMLGLTPLPIYDRFQSLPDFERSPILLRLGDRVKFIPIDDAECENLRQQVRECVYRFNIKEEMVSVEGG
ncbi:MAG: carboxyltransferase domain-containing protein, partial [Nitrospinota bacterium]